MSRSKNSYEVRAMKFLKQFVKYVDNFESIKRVNYAVNVFNLEKNRKVTFEFGATRFCLITADYVIKWDRRGESRNEDCECFGGCREEFNFYYGKAVPCGYGYMFCKPTLFQYCGVEFEIMPRIKMPTDDEEATGWFGVLTEDEQDFVNDYLFDVDSHNWGWKGCQVMFYDYAAMR